MSSDADRVLDTIDGALSDYEWTGRDAMRWIPPEQRVSRTVAPSGSRVRGARLHFVLVDEAAIARAGEIVTRAARNIGEQLRLIEPKMRQLTEALQGIGALPPANETTKERALRLRQTRNTGPTHATFARRGGHDTRPHPRPAPKARPHTRRDAR